MIKNLKHRKVIHNCWNLLENNVRYYTSLYLYESEMPSPDIWVNFATTCRLKYQFTVLKQHKLNKDISYYWLCFCSALLFAVRNNGLPFYNWFPSIRTPKLISQKVKKNVLKSTHRFKLKIDEIPTWPILSLLFTIFTWSTTWMLLNANDH